MLEGEELWDALDAAGIGVWSWRVGQDRVQWNPRIFELFGLVGAEAPAGYQSYLCCIHEDDRDAVHEAVQAALERATEMQSPGAYVVQHRVRLPDGTTRWLECRGRVMADENGAPQALSGISVDVTAHRQAEDALRDRAAAFRLYTEMASDYVYVTELTDPMPAPRIVAGSFERTTGLTPTMLVERGGWQNIIHPEDLEGAAGVLATVASGSPAVSEYRIVRPDGETRWLRDIIRPITDPQTGAVVELAGAVRDVTERRKLEEQLTLARKEEALARFSSNAAHDFNNLLTVILGSVELARRDDLPEMTLQLLEAIRLAGEQASELTRSMLLFGRRIAGQPQVLEVGDLIRRFAPMLRQGLGHQHELVVEMDEGPAFVRIDASQAQLMLLNLVMNARRAMVRGGTVTLRVSRREFHGGDQDRPAELVAGEYSLFELRDTGVGIPPEHLSRVFEPFFTTRDPGEGSGLGLSACRGIASRAGGTITVASQLGAGATFTVYLPSQPAPDMPGAQPTDVRVDIGGTERILFVDDEPLVRRLFGVALTELGYRVDQCDSAEDALEHLSEATYDLVVTDVVMPGMGGLELATRIREQWPEIAILVISGNREADHSHPFLMKPVTPRGIALRIRELLDD